MFNTNKKQFGATPLENKWANKDGLDTISDLSMTTRIPNTIQQSPNCAN